MERIKSFEGRIRDLENRFQNTKPQRTAETVRFPHPKMKTAPPKPRVFQRAPGRRAGASRSTKANPVK